MKLFLFNQHIELYKMWMDMNLLLHFSDNLNKDFSCNKNYS